jgi:hypothetical protein
VVVPERQAEAVKLLELVEDTEVLAEIEGDLELESVPLLQAEELGDRELDGVPLAHPLVLGDLEAVREALELGLRVAIVRVLLGVGLAHSESDIELEEETLGLRELALVLDGDVEKLELREDERELEGVRLTLTEPEGLADTEWDLEEDPQGEGVGDWHELALKELLIVAELHPEKDAQVVALTEGEPELDASKDCVAAEEPPRLEVADEEAHLDADPLCEPEPQVDGLGVTDNETDTVRVGVEEALEQLLAEAHLDADPLCETEPQVDWLGVTDNETDTVRVGVKEAGGARRREARAQGSTGRGAHRGGVGSGTRAHRGAGGRGAAAASGASCLGYGRCVAGGCARGGGAAATGARRAAGGERALPCGGGAEGAGERLRAAGGG